MMRLKNPIKLYHQRMAYNGLSSVGVSISTSSGGYMGTTGNFRIDNELTASSIGVRYGANVINALLGTIFGSGSGNCPSCFVNSDNYNNLSFEVALEIMKCIRVMSTEELLNYVNLLVSQESTYTDYLSKINNITVEKLKCDPYFYLLRQAYLLADTEYMNRLFLEQKEQMHQAYIDCQNEKLASSTFGISDFSVTFNYNTGIKTEYLRYIAYYGVPPDGVFIPSILERIKAGIINGTNYQQFTPSYDC